MNVTLQKSHADPNAFIAEGDARVEKIRVEDNGRVLFTSPSPSQAKELSVTLRKEGIRSVLMHVGSETEMRGLLLLNSEDLEKSLTALAWPGAEKMAVLAVQENVLSRMKSTPGGSAGLP